MEIAIVIVLLVIGYLAYDRWRHPFKRCPVCKGDGKKTSGWSKSAYGVCVRCNGRGEVNR